MINQRQQLRETFDRLWDELRGARLYAGQPRNDQSSSGIRLGQEALRLASEASDQDFLFEAWRMVAYSLSADEQWKEAIPYYEKAIHGYEARGEHAFAARHVRIGYVSALMLAGRYEDALNAASVAESLLKDSGDHVGYARLCTNLANLYQRLDQYQPSCDYYAKALEVFESTGDQQAMALIYQNLGYPLGRLERFEEADAMYERALQLAIQLDMQELGAQASYNRAYLLFLRGRHSEALQSFARLRQHFKNSGSLVHFALCDLDEAEIYLHLNIPSDALTLAQSASQQFERIGMVYERAKAQAFQGAALMQMHKFAEALEAFRAAQKAFADEGNNSWGAVLDLYRADIHLELKRYWEAHALADQAKKRFDKLGIASRKMLSLAVLSKISLGLNEISVAEGYTQEMAAIIEEHSATLRFPYYVIAGQIAERKRELARAEEAYALAAEDLEAHQSRLQHDDLMLTFLRSRNQVYESLVKLSLDNHPDHLQAAYSWCERSKSRGLIELLTQHFPLIQPHGEQSLLRRVQGLREELNIHYVLSKPEARQFRIPEVDTVVLKEQELARILREVEVNDPEYVSLQRVNPVDLNTVQSFVPADTTIIEFFGLQDEVIAFVIGADGTRVFRRLAVPNRIRTLQERLAFQLEKFRLGSEQSLENTNRHLQTLYTMLVAPMSADLHTSRLIIIPHGALHFLPFHAFFDGQQYLTDNFEISYAPSASVLRYCIEKPEVIGASPLILRVADEMARPVGADVQALSERFPDARALSGDQATRENFLQAARTASFVHVETNTNFRADNPMFSSFRLSDGSVTALDLFSMKCDVNLFTLSGGHSGRSEVSNGDDPLGLIRGFLYAGVRSLALSLWSVNDRSTTSLMTLFYDEWRKGCSPARALQVAMKTLRQSYPHPFHWSPFILVGKNK